LDTSRFSLPEGNAIERFFDNLNYFVANYVVMSALFFGYVLVVHPSVLVILSIYGVASALLLNYEKERKKERKTATIKFGEREVKVEMILGVVIGVSALSSVYVAFHTMISWIAFSLTVICAHALLHQRPPQVVVGKVINSLSEEIQKFIQ